MNPGDETLPAFMALLHERLLLCLVPWLLSAMPSETACITKTQGNDGTTSHALPVRKTAQNGPSPC